MCSLFPDRHLAAFFKTGVDKNLCPKHKLIVLYLSERAVQVAGRWARDGYPPGRAGCPSPNRAAGWSHPSRLHSPPRRTSRSARRRLHTGTGKALRLLTCHCCSLQPVFLAYLHPTNLNKSAKIRILNCFIVLRLTHSKLQMSKSQVALKCPFNHSTV